MIWLGIPANCNEKKTLFNGNNTICKVHCLPINFLQITRFYQIKKACSSFIEVLRCCCHLSRFDSHGQHCVSLENCSVYDKHKSSTCFWRENSVMIINVPIIVVYHVWESNSGSNWPGIGTIFFHHKPRRFPRLNFTNIFTHSFYASSSQKRNNSVKWSVSFYAFGIYGCKSCSSNLDEIDTWWQSSPHAPQFRHASMVSAYHTWQYSNMMNHSLVNSTQIELHRSSWKKSNKLLDNCFVIE